MGGCGRVESLALSCLTTQSPQSNSYRSVQAEQQHNGLGVAAIVLGICALVDAFIAFINYVTGFIAFVGLVLGLIGLFRKGRKKEVLHSG